MMGLPQPVVEPDEITPEEQEFLDIGQELIAKLEPLELPYDDGIPMESNWHRLQMNLLIELVEQHWQKRDDFFAGGNMFIYFDLQQAKNRDYRGPDFFVVKDTDYRPTRKSWIVWEEGGRYPHVIVELASPSTLKIDLGIKKQIYERTFRTPEYFCYDPETETLHGWRLEKGHYTPIFPDEHGRMECRELGLWIGPWQGLHMRINGTWLRFYTVDGALVPKFSEAEAQRANAEARRADAEAQKAEAEARRADAEARRADAAEAELKRLKAMLG